MTPRCRGVRAPQERQGGVHRRPGLSKTKLEPYARCSSTDCWGEVVRGASVLIPYSLKAKLIVCEPVL